jgi:hypothetical protein
MVNLEKLETNVANKTATDLMGLLRLNSLLTLFFYYTLFHICY